MKRRIIVLDQRDCGALAMVLSWSGPPTISSAGSTGGSGSCGVRIDLM
jgi:hypothetical protein